MIFLASTMAAERGICACQRGSCLFRVPPTAATASADMISSSFHQRLNTVHQHVVSAST